MPRARKQPAADSANTLRWVSKGRLKREFELRAADTVLGRLHWLKLLGSLAEAEYGPHRWTLKRGGFLRPHITVRQGSSEEDLAVIDLAWNGNGRLRIRTGRHYNWQRQGFWGRRFAFTDDNGSELLTFEASFRLSRSGSTVTIHPPAAKLDDLGLLLTLGWYVLVLITRDQAAALIATSGG